MAEVDLDINNHSYRVACEDGQEQRLHNLAVYLDSHVKHLADSLGQIGEARLMLLASLTICDELLEIKDARMREADELAPGALREANTALEDATNRLNLLAEAL
ncbi:MAG: cell division protein ZapA [Pseudomonadota bacterium]